MTSKALVLNLFAGPGTGKTTMMAAVFAELKFRGVDCEIAPEYAKEVVWGENMKLLEDQLYIFAKQAHRVFRIRDKVDVILTDSPLLFSLVYGEQMTDAFRTLVREQHHIYKSLNIFLTRSKPYNPNGRTQDENGAIELDVSILKMLDDNNINYLKIDSDKDNIIKIADMVEDTMKLYNEESVVLKVPK